MFFKNKQVLVAGGTGLVGIQLVKLLIEKQGANVRIASLDDPLRAHPGAEFIRTDLTSYENCLTVCDKMDYVFNLLCVKGSPVVTRDYPVDFLVPMTIFNLLLMEAARIKEVGGFLLTSTVGVYPPAEIFKEEDAFTGFPSPNDLYGAWSKLTAELQARAYMQQKKTTKFYSKIWDNISIVRPANIYGPYDNFDSINSMVIPSLIKRALSGENPFIAWGDGKPVRDFIHSRDVARGMIFAAEHGSGMALNLGSGTGITIKELVESVLENVNPKPEIRWDTNQPTGDALRILDTTKALAMGFSPQISLKNGIKEVIDFYRQHSKTVGKRYEIFDK